jgi:hypothetical protein
MMDSRLIQNVKKTLANRKDKKLRKKLGKTPHNQLTPNDKLLFRLLAREDWPPGVTCDACSNVSLLFSSDSHPERPSWTVSKNALKHHDSLKELLKCSEKCGLCALLLSCFGQYKYPEFLAKLIDEEKGTIPEVDDGESGLNWIYKVAPMIEECYGSGKLVSEFRITLQYTKYSKIPKGWDKEIIHITDDILRVYSEPGVFSVLIPATITDNL